MIPEAVYDRLWVNAIDSYRKNDLIVDTYLKDHNHDQRLGITLLLRPSSDVINKVYNFTLALRKIEPDQYYYPAANLHTTVLSIISCTETFHSLSIEPKNYCDKVSKAIDRLSPIEIEYRGITVSREAVLIQGFPRNNSLRMLRDALRSEFKTSNLFHTIDHRYKLSTAHITLMRFKDRLQRPKELSDFLRVHRQYVFGAVKTFKLELVINDWYQSSQKLSVLGRFQLQQK